MHKIEMIRREGNGLVLTLEILTSLEIANLLWGELLEKGAVLGIYALGMYQPSAEGWILCRWRGRGLYPKEGGDDLDTVGTLGKFGVDFTREIPKDCRKDLLDMCRAKVPGWAFIPVDLAAVATAPTVVEVLPSYSMAAPVCPLTVSIQGTVDPSEEQRRPRCSEPSSLSYGQVYANNVAWPDWVHYIVLQPWGKLVGFEQEPKLTGASGRNQAFWAAETGKFAELTYSPGVKWDLSYYHKICLNVTNTKQKKGMTHVLG